MASNATAAFGIPPLPDYKLESQPNIISWLADPYLTLACPVIAYWAVSMVFHVIDVYNLFPQYRLHTPAELLKRNHATRWEVCRDVLLQQVIQTLFGIALSFLEDDPLTGKDDYNVAVWAQRIRIAQSGIPAILATLGVNAGGLSSKMAMGYPTASNILAGGHYPSLLQTIAVNGELIAAPAFASWEMTVAKAIYWVGIPAVQFAVATMIVDAWQYFCHRAMHMNHWLFSMLFFRTFSAHTNAMRSPIPLSASPLVCSIRIRRAVQPSYRGILHGYTRYRSRLSSYRHDSPPINVVLYSQHNQNSR